jgi:hypothetical protein
VNAGVALWLANTNGRASNLQYILEETVIGFRMRRRRHQEFIRFLHALERGVPVGKVVHAIVDYHTTQNSPTSSNGSPIIRAVPFISLRPPPRGSTPSRASSRPSHTAKSGLSALYTDHFRQRHLRKTRSHPCIFWMRFRGAGVPSPGYSPIFSVTGRPISARISRTWPIGGFSGFRFGEMSCC